MVEICLNTNTKSQAIGYNIVGGHLRVPPLFRADTQVRPYEQITVCLQPVCSYLY